MPSVHPACAPGKPSPSITNKPSLRVLAGGRASQEDCEPEPLTVTIALRPLDVLASLPPRLRDAFLATDSPGFVLVCHNDPHASPSLRGEQMVDAERALVGAGYCVWPGSDGCSFEVSPVEMPHYIASAACKCGAPGGFGCICPPKGGA